MYDRDAKPISTRLANLQKIDIDAMRLYLGYVPCSGEIFWKMRRSNQIQAGQKAGYARRGYIILMYEGQYIFAHTVAWALHYGQWPTLMLDHRDGCRSNNRISNLRLATASQNAANAKRKVDNKTGFKGVVIRGGYKGRVRYSAKIAFNKKLYFLGVYDTPTEAHEVYCLAADLLHGEFANHG